MEKGGVYWNAWADLFNFHRSHAEMEQAEDTWDKICRDAVELERKYRGTKAEQFVAKVLVEILLELERAEKENTENEIK